MVSSFKPKLVEPLILFSFLGKPSHHVIIFVRGEPHAGSETKRMRILVSPTICLYRVADENALDALVQTLNLSSDVAKYLRQMCNFRKLPGDKRKEKHRAFGWVKLEDVRWLKRSGDHVLHVAFGARAEDMYKDMPIINAG